MISISSLLLFYIVMSISYLSKLNMIRSYSCRMLDDGSSILPLVSFTGLFQYMLYNFFFLNQEDAKQTYMRLENKTASDSCYKASKSTKQNINDYIIIFYIKGWMRDCDWYLHKYITTIQPKTYEYNSEHRDYQCAYFETRLSNRHYGIP